MALLTSHNAYNVDYDNDVELRQLRYFVVAAEEASISRAAARLHVSQPALSQQIRELEEELGCELFERTARGVRLRPAGRTLLDAGRRLLADAQAAKLTTKRAARGDAGTLRVAFNIASGRHPFVGKALHLFRAHHPEVALDLAEINSSQQVDAFRRGDIDVGFLYSDESHAHLTCEVLRRDRFALAMSSFHPLARLPEVQPAMLHGEPLVWLARSVSSSTHDRLVDFLHTHGIEPNIAQEVQSTASQLNMVAAGMGSGLVVEAPSMEQTGHLVLRPVAGLVDERLFCLARRPEADDLLVQNFVDIVRAALSSP